MLRMMVTLRTSCQRGLSSASKTRLMPSLAAVRSEESMVTSNALSVCRRIFVAQGA
jgi:hypothetical protein